MKRIQCTLPACTLFQFAELKLAQRLAFAAANIFRVPSMASKKDAL